MSNLSHDSLLPIPVSCSSSSTSSLSSSFDGSFPGIEGEGLGIFLEGEGFETFLVEGGSIKIGAGRSFFFFGF